MNITTFVSRRKYILTFGVISCNELNKTEVGGRQCCSVFWSHSHPGMLGGLESAKSRASMNLIRADASNYSIK